MSNFQCVSCDAPYEPARPWQKYCSPQCQQYNPIKSSRTREFQRLRREKINKIKLLAGCAQCGYRDHPAALDFNHVPERGAKLFNISQDPKRSWALIEAEIAKCDVLCSNCHRVLTYENRHWHTLRGANL